MSRIILDNRKLLELMRTQPQRVQAWGDGFAQQIVTDIQLSMGTSPRGRAYMRGKSVHFASLPGYPPNVDTGALRASMRWARVAAGQWRIYDGVDYGYKLEMGINVQARPFVRPAMDRARLRLPLDIAGLIE